MRAKPAKRTLIKKVDKSKLKKAAWKAFSRYIRLRDCLVTTGTKTHAKCVTCGRVYSFNELDAGHFIDGRGGSVLFDEDLVNAQCQGCNRFKHGNKDAYTPFMIKRYGLKKVEEFWALKNQIKSWSIEELEEIRKYYIEEFKNAYENN